MSHKYRGTVTLWILAAVFSMGHVPPCRADPAAEFLLFPSVRSVFRPAIHQNSALDDEDHDATVELFLTAEVERTRFLAEFLASNDGVEFERLQLGWAFGPHLIWLGRFHNPIGHWNSQFHHGTFLQTSISRPSIIEYEDHGGILPVHLTGLMLEGEIDRGELNLGYALAVGAGPDLKNELEPWDVLSPRSGLGDLGVTLNMYLGSDEYISNRIGLFVSRTKLPTKGVEKLTIRQSAAGAYGNWETGRWRLLGAAFFVENELGQDPVVRDSFVNFYLQTEYLLNERWTAFGRLEETAGEAGDAYLALFPRFVDGRVLAGLRFEFTDRNAMTLEVASSELRRDDFAELSLQWSAQF